MLDKEKHKIEKKVDKLSQEEQRIVGKQLLDFYLRELMNGDAEDDLTGLIRSCDVYDIYRTDIEKKINLAIRYSDFED